MKHIENNKTLKADGGFAVMTKVMVALALVLAGVLTLGMSQRAVAAEGGAQFDSAVAPVVLYEEGVDFLLGRNGHEKDMEQALAHFRYLADRGWAIAQSKLGDLYREGDGVAKDRSVAYMWYRRAAAQQFPPAQEKLEALASEMTESEREQADRTLASL